MKPFLQICHLFWWRNKQKQYKTQLFHCHRVYVTLLCKVGRSILSKNFAQKSIFSTFLVSDITKVACTLFPSVSFSFYLRLVLLFFSSFSKYQFSWKSYIKICSHTHVTMKEAFNIVTNLKFTHCVLICSHP